MDLPIQQEKIIKGDARSVSIAAASIIAKVYRDQLMKEYDVLYPGYGFSHNAGYGTKEHLEGLERQGITPIHRKSFAPVKIFTIKTAAFTYLIRKRDERRFYDVSNRRKFIETCLYKRNQ